MMMMMMDLDFDLKLGFFLGRRETNLENWLHFALWKCKGAVETSSRGIDWTKINASLPWRIAQLYQLWFCFWHTRGLHRAQPPCVFFFAMIYDLMFSRVLKTIWNRWLKPVPIHNLSYSSLLVFVAAGSCSRWHQRVRGWVMVQLPNDQETKQPWKREVDSDRCLWQTAMLSDFHAQQVSDLPIKKCHFPFSWVSYDETITGYQRINPAISIQKSRAAGIAEVPTTPVWLPTPSGIKPSVDRLGPTIWEVCRQC